MKNNDTSFLVILAIALILLGLIVADNVASMAPVVPGTPAIQASPAEVPATTTETAPAKRTDKDISLHEAKYWKPIHE